MGPLRSGGVLWTHSFVPSETDEYVSRLEKKALERLRAELKKYSI